MSSPVHQLSTYELAIRLLLAGGLGAMVGFEREWRDRTAGLRTHMLVCIGSAVFTIISAYAFTGEGWYVDGRTSLVSDPSRIAAQIVSGIGFLGAGAIFRSDSGVRGLTTAASLWAMAAIGMAAGAGQYEMAIVSTVVIVFVLAVLRTVPSRIKHLRGTEAAVLRVDIFEADAYARVFDVFGAVDARISNITVKARRRDSNERRMAISVEFPAHHMMTEITASILAIEGVGSVEVDDISSS